MSRPVDRRAFLEERRKGCGSSDIAALCNVHPYGKTVLDVFRDKVEPLPEILPDPEPAQERGLMLEPVVATKYAATTGYRLRRSAAASVRDQPWILAHPDRVVVGEKGVVEIKTLALHLFAQLRHGGLSEAYQLQAQQILLCTRAKWLDFALFSAERWALVPVRVYPDAAIQSAIVEIVSDFWHHHVLTRVPPPETGYAIDIPTTSIMTRIEDEERLQILDTLLWAKALRREVDRTERLAVENMKALLPTYGGYEAPAPEPGRVHRIYYQRQDGRRTLDMDQLRGAGLLEPWPALETLQRILGRELSHQEVEWLRACRADLGQYMKVGEPFSTLNVKPNVKDSGWADSGWAAAAGKPQYAGVLSHGTSEAGDEAGPAGEGSGSSGREQGPAAQVAGVGSGQAADHGRAAEASDSGTHGVADVPGVHADAEAAGVLAG